MRIILLEDYSKLLPIIDKGDRLINGAYAAYDGKTDDWDIWRPVYDAIFSEDVSGKIYDILKGFDPYIPDTTYQEDVCAFWHSFKREMEDVRII